MISQLQLCLYRFFCRLLYLCMISNYGNIHLYTWVRHIFMSNNNFSTTTQEIWTPTQMYIQQGIILEWKLCYFCKLEKERSCLLLFLIEQELTTSILNRIAFRALGTKLSKQLQYMKQNKLKRSEDWLIQWCFFWSLA